VDEFLEHESTERGHTIRFKGIDNYIQYVITFSIYLFSNQQNAVEPDNYKTVQTVINVITKHIE